MRELALREIALFSGAGGGLLASRLLGWTTIGACEIEQYPREVVMQRQRDGMLDDFPIWDDVCTFDGRPWRGHCDIITGGFPCTDISAAGKGAGITGERSGLWKEYARIIGEVRPQFVFAENSPLLRTRGLGVVIEDLASMGYDVRWGVLGARDVGANHLRRRMWVLAHSHSESVRLDEQREEGRRDGVQDEGHSESVVFGEDRRGAGSRAYSNFYGPVADADSLRLQRQRPNDGQEGRQAEGRSAGLCDREEPRRIPGAAWWGTEPDILRVAHGMAPILDGVISDAKQTCCAKAVSAALFARWEDMHSVRVDGEPSASPPRPQRPLCDSGCVFCVPPEGGEGERDGHVGRQDDAAGHPMRDLWKALHSASHSELVALRRDVVFARAWEAVCREETLWKQPEAAGVWILRDGVHVQQSTTAELQSKLWEQVRCTQKKTRAKRLKAIGNGQVPQVAATAFRILSEGWM